MRAVSQWKMNTLVWSASGRGRTMAAAPQLLNPASRSRRPVGTTMNVRWGSRIRRVRFFPLLLELTGAPFLLNSSLGSALRRKRPFKVFPFILEREHGSFPLFLGDVPKPQVGMAALGGLRKCHYHLKTKEPNERWPGKCPFGGG